MTAQSLPSLNSRLAAVAALVPEGARVADVGCDHGLLALHLAAGGRCAACVAIEIDDAVLARARRPPAGAAWSDRISWRVSDGVRAVAAEDRIDTIVVAGLGAATIVRVLAAPQLSALALRRLVVQPQTDSAGVRRWLVDHRWEIVAETVVGDRGRFYEIAAAEPGDGNSALIHPELSPDDVLAVGPVLLRSAGAEVLALWEARRRRLDRIVAAGARGAMADRAARERWRALRILAALGGRPVTSPGG